MSDGSASVAERAPYHAFVRDSVFPLFPSAPVDGVLDVGGGYGNTAAAAKTRLGAKNAGVIDAVASRERVSPDLDFFAAADLNDAAAVEQVCERHGPFSVILCLDVLEHLVDPWACVRALERHLRSGGALIASIPNVAHLSVSAALLFRGRWRLVEAGIMDRTHLRFFTKDTAIELLQSGSLKVDHCSQNLDGARPYRYLNWLRHFGLADRFAYQYFLRARRPSAPGSGP
jgi:2-polyprenyl-3-methyl-5-hydroxy-6-metoxy-1,4-benzoquinol methylase